MEKENLPGDSQEYFFDGYRVEELIDDGEDPVPPNLVSLADFSAEVDAYSRRRAQLEAGDGMYRVRNWYGEHKTVTIVGTATAIGLALGGLYALRKKRGSQE